MGKLRAALEWAKRGFPVFPLRENSREPAFGQGWTELATTDEETIRSWWVDPVLKCERDYNVGCVCTGMVVVDIDVKNGKQGIDEYALIGGTYDTLVVQTATGGFHCYFTGPDSSNVGISEAIDIRSHNGYVVAPGSVIDGVEYSIVRDGAPAPIPEHLRAMLTPYRGRNENEYAQVNDSPAAIQAGINFASSAPPAIEGMRGDETTFMTAARMVREMGLSVVATYQIMRDVYNPRCSPPWDLDDLYRKVENAANYGTAQHGVLSPEQMFADARVEPPPSVFQQVQHELDFGNPYDPYIIEPRPWIIERMLMRRAVTVIGAAGSAGKSTVSLALAASLIAGQEFAGHKVLHRCRVMVYNGEDDITEQSRRLWANCATYKLDYERVKRDIMLMSARELKLSLVTREGGRAVRNDTLINQLIEKAIASRADVLILDPLIKVHQVDESDNVHMDTVMEVLTDIAHLANVSVLVLHHTVKGAGQSELNIGNPDVFRGASAIKDAARVAFTMYNASLKDQADYGLQDEERLTWVRMDDAKMNMSLASDKATWFKKGAVHIPSGDLVGVLEHKRLEADHMHIRNMTAKILIDQMTLAGEGSMSLISAIAALKTNSAVYANQRDAEIRKKLEGYFFTRIEYQGKGVQMDRTTNPAEPRLAMR